jgi:hypothetical protein
MRALAVGFLMSVLGAHAQQRIAHASLGSEQIRIGEQTDLIIEANAAAGAVDWPIVGDTLTQRVAVVRSGRIDTLGDRGILRRSIRITGFDTGYWAIPPLRLTIGGRPAETEPLLLHVVGVPIDANGEPRADKPLIELPFSPLWWLREHGGWFAGAAILAVIAVVIMLLIKRRKPVPKTAPAELAIPLPERVLALLQDLERRRLWQQGEHKAYQSQLTDILRGYVEERFQVPALERTTDELVHELRVSPMLPEQQTLLANMLRAADLVKFAKAIPGPTENEQLMASAIRFVRETAPTNPIAHAPQS